MYRLIALSSAAVLSLALSPAELARFFENLAEIGRLDLPHPMFIQADACVVRPPRGNEQSGGAPFAHEGWRTDMATGSAHRVTCAVPCRVGSVNPTKGTAHDHHHFPHPHRRRILGRRPAGIRLVVDDFIVGAELIDQLLEDASGDDYARTIGHGSNLMRAGAGRCGRDCERVEVRNGPTDSLIRRSKSPNTQ